MVPQRARDMQYKIRNIHLDLEFRITGLLVVEITLSCLTKEDKNRENPVPYSLEFFF